MEQSRNQMVYRVGTSSLAAEAVKFLESRNINDYQISGPTMEELFLKATGDRIASTEDNSTAAAGDMDPVALQTVTNANSDYELVDGHPISVYKQWYILLGKRFRIFRRRYVPYIVAVAFAVAGAGVAPLIIKSFTEPMGCPSVDTLIYDTGVNRYDWGNDKYSFLLIGPPEKVTDQWLERIVRTYSTDRFLYSGYYGYSNVSDLQDQIGVVDSYEAMVKNISDSQNPSRESNFYSRSTLGGLWLGDDEAPIMFLSQRTNRASITLNVLTNIASGVDVSTGYYEFGEEVTPSIYDIKPTLFIIYYGLILAAYPAFFAVSSYLTIYRR
jgi:ATP-binding cassette subfamily A (ABC1) protein 3